MKRKTPGRPSIVLGGVLLLCGASLEASHIKPGFNLFSVEQDVEIGRLSAREAERQLPLMRDARVDRYLDEIVRRLAAQAPGARYPYNAEAVDADEINAMSLPGGPMYVNRGLIEAARSESELAGVLAHEMAHVALRHGTHQASKAYLAQAGIGLLGGLLGRGGGDSSQIINAIGGLGLNALFLKFSRSAEYDADAIGVEMMAQAGYSPLAMADFFELLRQQGKRNPGRLEQFFSSHPPAAEREARIRQQARSLGSTRSQEIGDLEAIKQSLRGMPRKASGRPRLQEAPSAGGIGRSTPADIRLEPPSSRFERFEQRNGFFNLDYPSNWRPYQEGRGFGVTIVPPGGVVDLDNGQQAIVAGAIVNHYDPFEARRDRGPLTMDEATDDIVRQITRSNSYLRSRRKQRNRIDGRPAYVVELVGRSPVTGEQERVTVYTRALRDEHVLYVLTIAPGRAQNSFAPAFDRMLRSLQVNDDAAHSSGH